MTDTTNAKYEFYIEGEHGKELTDIITNEFVAVTGVVNRRVAGGKGERPSPREVYAKIKRHIEGMYEGGISTGEYNKAEGVTIASEGDADSHLVLILTSALRGHCKGLAELAQMQRDDDWKEFYDEVIDGAAKSFALGYATSRGDGETIDGILKKTIREHEVLNSLTPDNLTEWWVLIIDIDDKETKYGWKQRYALDNCLEDDRMRQQILNEDELSIHRREVLLKGKEVLNRIAKGFTSEQRGKLTNMIYDAVARGYYNGYNLNHNKDLAK